MSTQPETKTSHPKRKRPSKNQQAADNLARKRVKSDHAPPSEKHTAEPVVNGSTEESQHDEATIPTNGIPQPNTAKVQNEPHGSERPMGQKRKRKSDTESEKTNGFDAQSGDKHDETELHRQQDRSSLEQTPMAKKIGALYVKPNPKTPKVDDDSEKPIEPLKGPHPFAPQSSALDGSMSAQDVTLVSQNGSRKTKSKKKKPKMIPGDKAISVRSTNRKQSWIMTEPLGGHFIHHDPIFSLDER